MGTIIDIQRFSLNDGPGIRTTVFFKGCPLNCVWCHNPESKSFRPQLSYNDDICLQCKQCKNICNNNVHSFNKNHFVNFASCISCGKCVSVCPVDALKIYGYESSVEDIINIVNKDKSYYDTSNGGLTVSGGEPMFQFDFLKELLITAKRNKINTAIETCGYANTEQFAELLPICDWFLFDHKAPTEIHKELTGVNDKLILKNLSFLLDNGAKVILRCPIIPNVNGTDKQLNEFISKYPKLYSVDKLPYHDLGKSKAKHIGVEYPEY